MARNRLYDIAKGIGIILVVLGHMISRNSVPSTMIYAFHMPLLFFLSGCCTDMQVSVKCMAEKKYRQLIIPCFFFTFVGSFVDYYFLGNSKAFTCLSYIFPFGLWFLPILFFASIICCIALKYIKNRFLLIIFFILIIYLSKYKYTPPNITNMFPYHIHFLAFEIQFVILGHFFHKEIEKKYFHINNKVIWLIFMLLLFVVDVIVLIPSSVNPISISLLNTMAAFCGIFIVLYLSKLIVNKKSGIFDYLGRNTIIILPVHVLGIHFSCYYVKPLFTNLFIYKFFELILVWIICVGFIQLFNWKLNFLIGKS